MMIEGLEAQRYQTLVDVDTVAAHLQDPRWIFVDCRFDLADLERGEREYRAAHLPGAVYAHLDRDLSSAPVTDRGRHPLPSPATIAGVFGRLGIDGGDQVVAYDDTGGHYAARLWWMLRYMGHTAAAVMDGGWPAWLDAGLPTVGGWETRSPAHFTGAPRAEWLVLIDDVPDVKLLIDSRNPERYRGEVEPIDPVAGHVPGALNRPYGANWTAGGRWKAPADLRAEFEALLGDTPADQAVFYCGSGVSACVNLLGLVHAGLPDARLYLGGWSEWCRLRPVGPSGG